MDKNCIQTSAENISLIDFPIDYENCCYLKWHKMHVINIVFMKYFITLDGGIRDLASRLL